jgi:hypothetical protein
MIYCILFPELQNISFALYMLYACRFYHTCCTAVGNFLRSVNSSTYKPIAHDVTAAVTMHLEDKLAIYA